MKKKRLFAMLAGSSLAAIAAGAPALAQQNPAPAQAAAGEGEEEIVVTGTQIRGVAPVGSSVIGLTEEDIEATGALDTGELLTNLPQAANLFNQDNVVAGGGTIGGNARNAVIRPNLRNLPGVNNSSGSPTLLMVDGHRVIGAGIGTLAVDPETIPPGALARVEAMTDGSSAIYGSDAIGGILNFITRREFDGVEISANTGFADSYAQAGAGFIAGTTWNGGSGYVSYNYAYHDALFGRDRDFITLKDWATGIPTARTCANMQFTRSTTPGVVYDGAGVASTAAALNCDYTDDATFSPETTRHNVFANFQQELSDTLHFDMRASYQSREDLNIFGGLRPGSGTGTGLSVVVPASNFYRQQLQSAGRILPGDTVTAFFNYGSVLGNASQTAITRVQSWQITPTLTWDVGGDWQIRALASYGESESEYDNLLVNTTLQTAALAGNSAATAINPFNLAATQNLQLIRDIASFHDRGESHNTLTNYRVIADGGLFDLPGGTVRLAAGLEYMQNDYRSRITDQAARVFLPYGTFAQEVTSEFVELSVPVVGEGNNVPLVQSLTLSLSGRRDEYNDFGATTNPRVGVTWELNDWLEMRGTWGTSFNAPTAPDGVGATFGPRLRILPASVLYPTGATGPNGSGTVTVPALPPPPPGVTYQGLIMDQAPIQGMQPQESENWGAGFTVRPPWVDGLSVDLSYYHIDLAGLINFPLAGSIAQGFSTYGTAIIDVTVTPAEVASALALTPAQTAALTQQIATNNFQIVSIVDNRTRNLGNVWLDGVDFQVRYDHDTSWGSFDVSLAGNYQLNSKGTLGGRVTDNLDFATVFRAALTVGADVGNFRGQVTLNHSGQTDIAPSASVFNQSELDAFNVVNAFFRYDFEGEGPSVTLNVNNIFDTDPPELRDRSDLTAGYGNGFSLGRMIQVGVTKRF